MSNVTIQKVVVDAKSRYGVLDKLTSKWVNTQDAKVLASIVIGKEYDLEMGKDAKNRTVFTAAKLVSNAIPAAYKAKSDIKDVKPFTESSFQNKDGRILAQGVVQHLTVSPITATMTPEELVVFVTKTSPTLIELVKKLSA